MIIKEKSQNGSTYADIKTISIKLDIILGSVISLNKLKTNEIIQMIQLLHRYIMQLYWSKREEIIVLSRSAVLHFWNIHFAKCILRHIKLS